MIFYTFENLFVPSIYSRRSFRNKLPMPLTSFKFRTIQTYGHGGVHYFFYGRKMTFLRYEDGYALMRGIRKFFTKAGVKSAVL